LFLENDKNDSVGQYTGQVPLGVGALAQWLAMLSDLKALGTQCGFQHVHLIAPSKEAVYDQWYPHRERRSDKRPVDELLRSVPADAPIIYPSTELRAADRMPVFDKGDTHWNGYGSFIAAHSVLRKLGRPDALSFDDYEFPMRLKSGDLDSKLVPQKTEQRIYAEPRSSVAQVVFDSEIANRGRTIVRENPLAPLGRLLMFGDSFGWGLAPFFTAAFQRFVFVHSTTPDRIILEQERPDAVLTECTERFVIEGPRKLGSFKVTDVARHKFKRAPAAEQERLRSLYEAKAASGTEPFYSSLFLETVI
jgi:hypothetical protein